MKSKLYVSLVHVNDHVILAIMNPEHRNLPLIICDDELMTQKRWADFHRELTGLSSPQLQHLLYLKMVEIEIHNKCWIMTDLWKHAWGEDHWLHIMHDDGEICGKNDEHYLNGKKAGLTAQAQWMVATGYDDYMERIQSHMAKGEQTWVLNWDMVIEPAASYSFA